MSVDINVFIEKSQLPTKSDWEALIEKYGFDLKMHQKFDPGSDSGFQSCKFNGVDVGFEYYCDGIEDTTFAQDEHPELKGKDLCIGFCSSYEHGDLSSAMIMAGTLAKHTNGTFWLMDAFQMSEDPICMAKHIVENGLG